MLKFLVTLLSLLQSYFAYDQRNYRILQSNNSQLQAVLETTSKISLAEVQAYPTRLVYFEDQTILIGILTLGFQQVGYLQVPQISSRNIQGTKIVDDFWPMTQSQTESSVALRMTKFGTEHFGSVWQSLSSAPGTIIASIKTKTGDTIVDEFSVSPLFTTSLNHASPDILYLSNGNYVVSWIGPKTSADVNLTVSFKIYAGGTKTQIKSVDVLTLSATTSLNTRLVLLANNQFMLMFQHVTGGNIQINYQVFDNAGNSQGNVSSLGQSTFNNAEACLLSDGKVAVVYVNNELYMQIFDITSPGSGQTIQVDSSGATEIPGVAPLANGNIVVTWENAENLYLQAYKSDGTAILASDVNISPTGGVLAHLAVPIQVSGDSFLVAYRTISDGVLHLRKFYMGTSTLSYVGFTSNRDSQQNNVTNDAYSNRQSAYRVPSSFSTQDIIMISVVGGGPLIVLSFIACLIYKCTQRGKPKIQQVAPEPKIVVSKEEIKELNAGSPQASQRICVSSANTSILNFSLSQAPKKKIVDLREGLKGLYQ